MPLTASFNNAAGWRPPLHSLLSSLMTVCTPKHKAAVCVDEQGPPTHEMLRVNARSCDIIQRTSSSSSISLDLPPFGSISVLQTPSSVINRPHCQRKGRSPACTASPALFQWLLVRLSSAACLPKLQIAWSGLRVKCCMKTQSPAPMQAQHSSCSAAAHCADCARKGSQAF